METYYRLRPNKDRDKLENSFGMSINDFEAIYDCGILIHHPVKSLTKKSLVMISKVDDLIADYDNPCDNVIETEFKLIGSETDANVNPGHVEGIVKVFKTIDGILFASLDKLGNIFMTDIVHENRDQSILMDFVIKHCWDERFDINTYRLNKLTNDIIKLDHDAIEKVYIEVKFDKNKWIKEATSKIDSFMKIRELELKRSSEFKNRILNEKIDDLKHSMTMKISEGFIMGLAAQNKGDIWEINKDGSYPVLTLKGKIYAKFVKKDNMIFELKGVNRTQFYIENLSVEIFPGGTVSSNGRYKSSNHVNTLNNDVCMGDMGNKPVFEYIKKVRENFSVLNLDSAYDDGRAFEQAGNIWSRHYKKYLNEGLRKAEDKAHRSVKIDKSIVFDKTTIDELTIEKVPSVTKVWQDGVW